MWPYNKTTFGGIAGNGSEANRLNFVSSHEVESQCGFSSKLPIDKV